MSKITSAMAVLGVVAGLSTAAFPLSSYAVQSSDVTVRATIESNIAVSVSDTLVDLGNIIGDGPVKEGITTTVTVTTNNAKGYTLKVEDVDGDLAMNNKNGQLAKIPAGVPEVGTSAWGIKGGAITSYQGLTADGLTLATVENPTGDDLDQVNSGVTEVSFGVSAAAGLASGIYENVVIFTAEANS